MSRRPTPKVRDDATVADAYVALRSSLLAYLRRHVDDAQAAEDLLQDVVLKALLARSDEAPRNLGAWLYGIARNAAIDHHRRRRPLEPMTDELIEGLAADGPDEAVIAREALANCLRSMAERLPEAYRDTVLAAEFDGRPLREVAAAQGVSLDAAKQRASRARRMLHSELVRCCRVALSESGELVDFDATAVAACQPGGDGACGGCDHGTRRR